MLSFRSTRHPLNFYTAVALASLFFLTIGIMLTLLPKQGSGSKMPSQLAPIVAVLIIAFAVYTVWRYRSNAPIVELDDQFIRIGADTWIWEQVSSVQLIGKRDFVYVGNYPMCAAEIRFADGQTRVLFDAMYSNYFLLKQELNRKINGYQTGQKPAKAAGSNSPVRGWEEYRGHAVFSFRGIMLWSVPVILLAISFTYQRASEGTVIFTGLFSLGWIILNSCMMFYFRVNDTHLQIRNHYFSWIKKEIALEVLLAAGYETDSSRRADGLRIFRTNFRTRLYRAGSLNDKTWKALAKALMQRRVAPTGGKGYYK